MRVLPRPTRSDEIRGVLVGQTLGGCFGGFGVFDEVDDLFEGRVFANPFDLQFHGAVEVDGAGEDLVADGFVGRE